MAFSIRRIARHALLFRSLIIRFYAYFFGLFLFHFAKAFVAMRLLARLVFMCMQIKKVCASDFARFFLPWEECFFGDINSKEQLCISPFKTIMYADSLATFGYVKSNKRI